MFKSVTPPLPDDAYIKNTLNAIDKHLSALSTVQNGLNDYFKRSINKFASTSPVEIAPYYEMFAKSGSGLAAAFGSFIEKMQPVLNSAQELRFKRQVLSDLLSTYQRNIREVRTAATKETIEREEKALLAFANKFTEFNKDSNAFALIFLTLYVACGTQLSYDVQTFLKTLTAEIEKFEPVETTQEEIELEQLISELEEKIAQKESKKKATKVVAADTPSECGDEMVEMPEKKQVPETEKEKGIEEAPAKEN